MPGLHGGSLDGVQQAIWGEGATSFAVRRGAGLFATFLPESPGTKSKLTGRVHVPIFQDQPPSSRPAADRLHDAVKGIVGSLSELAQGRAARLDPDISGDLFCNRDVQNEKTYDLYHYSGDLNRLDPNAQVDLMRFMGDAVRLSAMQTAAGGTPAGPELRPLMDRVLVQAAFFDRWLARRALTADVLTGKLAGETLRSALARFEADDARELERVADLASAPLEELDRYLPRQEFGFCVFATRKSEPGEQIINGVWFPAEEGARLAAMLARMQAESPARPLS